MIACAQTGKRKRDEATVDEMVERFPFLKNAPMEGGGS